MKVMKYSFSHHCFVLVHAAMITTTKIMRHPRIWQQITVDASEISIAQGDTRTVKITSGNGEYEVTSANEEVVTAEARW